MKKKYYSIKEVAERTGISAYTLRCYDKEGLLPFLERSETGNRMFKEEDFEPLYTIACLKRSGMSIEEIKKFMDLYKQGNQTIHERKILFEEHKKRLQEEIDTLNEMMKIVDYKCWYFSVAEEKKDINYYLKEKEEDVDPRIREFNQKVIDFRNGKD